MKEAVAKMKAELGDDAVILHTKKYKEGGLLGLGSKDMVEITAAIEDEKPESKKESEIQRPMMPQSVLSQYKTNGTAEGVAIAERELSPISKTEDLSDEDNESSATMDPKVNQASSLEAAMNSDQNRRVPRPDPPMPYDTEETSTIPYEVEFSSRSDLNTPKTEPLNNPEEQAQDNQFIKSQSMELKESDIEDEPDENVYTAEPPVNDAAPNDNPNNAPVSNVLNVQPYNDLNVAADSSTTQVGSTQSIPSETMVQSTVAESTQQPAQQQVPESPQPQPEQPQAQYQAQPASINQPTPTAAPAQTPQSVPAQQLQSQPQVQPQPQPQSTVPQASPVNPVQPIQPVQTVQAAQPVQPAQPQPMATSPQIQQDQAVNLNNAQMVPGNPTEQAVNAQPQAEQPLTPTQLAQAQAMMMAQFNQMQMAQMQQAMAQVQAQAQEQVRQAYLQAQQASQSHNQSHQQSDLHESNVAPSINKVSTDDNSQDKIKKLENEIAQMKALLAQVMGKDNNQGSISLHEALRRQEVNEEILNNMAAHAEAGETLSDSQSREAKLTLKKFLSENINFSEGIKLNRHGVRIAALLGTTGVGKTTTLAKIAAKFVLEQGITAALITADTYRISAVEQLRTYSDILGLPLEIVYSPAELSKAINKHRNKDLILIDTAGRSQHNEYQLKELQEFLRTNQRIEKHIVLSATTKISDAKDILEKFSICEPDKIIFTKTDETARVGLILNLLFKQKLSLSYLTNGQSVPDDITPASSESLVDLLLRKTI